MSGEAKIITVYVYLKYIMIKKIHQHLNSAATIRSVAYIADQGAPMYLGG
jgi:hypothetical protein